MPRASPAARTSSLKSSRSGSMSLSFMRSGRPPTLWWLLMTALGPRTLTLSMTSGVEGALNQVLGVLDAGGVLLEDFDEDAADDLALLLGVGDAGERAQELFSRVDRARGSGGSSGAWCARRSRTRRRAAGRCPRRCRRGGRRAHWWQSTAATEESTPPLRPQITRSSGATVGRDRGRSASSTKEPGVQSGSRPDHAEQERAQELDAARGVRDFGVELDAEHALRSGSAMAARGAFGLGPTARKPLGSGRRGGRRGSSRR